MIEQQGEVGTGEVLVDLTPEKADLAAIRNAGVRPGVPGAGCTTGGPAGSLILFGFAGIVAFRRRRTARAAGWAGPGGPS